MKGIPRTPADGSDLFHGGLFEAIGIPILIVRHSDGVVVDANLSARKFYGEDPSKPVGTTLSSLEAVGDANKAAVGPDSNRLPDGRATVRSRHRLRDGSECDVEMRISRFVFDGEDFLAVIINDVTNALKTESELQEALRRAETAGRARSEFLANASHEFRTPVSGIIGIAALLADSSLDEDQRHLLSLMEGAAKDLERMLRDLLDISRIDIGKVQIKRESFEVPAFVERVAGLHSMEAAEKGLILSWKHKGKDSFFGDETRLAQVLGNLLSNAVKYTDEGEIEVASFCGDNLELTVSDTGKGIPDAKKTEIFEMFRQVENPYTKERPGLGLGLAIVRSLIDLMGGTVAIEDNPDGGSTFRLVIPLPPDAPGRGTGDESRSSPRVLVVEDDQLSRYYLSTIIRKRGFEVEEAPDGETVLEKYDPYRYLAILMDVGLPRISGIEVTREWRSREKGRRRTPILAVTAHGFQSDKDECFAAGMDDFFLKPVDEPALTAKLKALAEAENKA